MKRFLLVIFASILVCAITAPSFSSAGEHDKSCKKAQDEKCKEGEKAQCGETCTSYRFKFYGYIKGDMIYDQAETYPGNFALWVPYSDDDNMMNVTARETRLGLDFTWKENEIATQARLEFDFYGLGVMPAGLNAMENKAAPMLRHAFLKITRGRCSILAGQTSDVISPLVPKTVNYTVCWAQGNIGYRRPQLRVSTWTGLGENAKINAAFAATRTLGSDIDGDKIDDGTDAGFPSIQGRLGFDMNFGESNLASLGASAHYGQEKWGSEDSTETESWSFNTDLKLVLGSKVSISGEFFIGENLATYFGGIGQSVNPLTNEILTMGGWGMISVKPIGHLTFNAGYSFDDPDDEKFQCPPGVTHPFKDKNSVIFGNLMYGLTSNVTAMFEVSYLKTEYMIKTHETIDLEDDVDALRLQLALKAAIK